MIKNVQMQMTGEVFQHFDAGNAVSFGIQGRPVYTDTGLLIDKGKDTSAYAALGGDADPNGKFTGTIVHSAGEHQGFDGFNNQGIYEAFAGLGMNPVIS